MPKRTIDQLDRGWDRLERGKPEAALEVARRVLRGSRDCAEAHLLVGAAQLDLGQAEDALASFRSALEIDPDDLDALLYAAETLTSLDEPEEALPLCDHAASVATGDDQRTEVEILRVEALLTLDEREAAAGVIRRLPDPPYPHPELALRAAEAALATGEIDRAEILAKAVIDEDADAADAHHLLGLVAEQRGDAQAMTRCFLRVRELDLREPPPAWGMRPKDFNRIAEQALAELPAHIRQRLANVPIIASDYPSAEVVAEGCDPRMMGFFSGVPYPDKSHVAEQQPHLDCIFLYQRNIEGYSRSRQELIEEIRKTLLHETGHFFALDDDDLEAIGLG